MGWHVIAVFAPLTAADVPVEGQVAVPVRGRVDPALRPAHGPGAVGDLVSGNELGAKSGTEREEQLRRRGEPVRAERAGVLDDGGVGEAPAGAGAAVERQHRGPAA